MCRARVLEQDAEPCGEREPRAAAALAEEGNTGHDWNRTADRDQSAAPV